MEPKPQAFIALPREARQSGLQNVIEETLRNNGVDVVSILISDSSRALSITANIQDLIRKATFVVADVSGGNPNVMLEVGMAMGMGQPILLLSRDRAPELPVDLAAQQVAVYNPDDLSSVRRYLELWLRDAIAERA
jgi:hypothetical protein